MFRLLDNKVQDESVKHASNGRARHSFQRRDGLTKYTLVKLQERRIIRDQLTVTI